MNIQTLFDQQPVIAGLLVFVIIFAVIIIPFLIILIVKKIKNKSWNIFNFSSSKTNFKQESLNTNNIPKEEKKEITKYYVVDFNNKGNLQIKNLTDNFIIENPSKNDFLNILDENNKNEKLILPIDNIEITIDKNDKNKYITSSNVKDKNLFIFNLFLKHMSSIEAPWATSKFI
ncbi:hypothetical protein ACJA29_03495 [Metamycoplasma sualvi]|uniref:hypothetical protein n=1 Tax=Metamycoplasma sualvi TaxID=2125 RepID=UPI003872BD68